MTRRKPHSTSTTRPAASSEGNAAEPAGAPQLNRLEFHRNAVGMIPDPADRDPGVAVMVFKDGGKDYDRFCSCSAFGKKSCPHLRQLAAVYQKLCGTPGVENPLDGFPDSMWHALARFFGEDGGDPLERTTARLAGTTGNPRFHILAPDGREILTYLSPAADGSRFLERCCHVEIGNTPRAHTRGHLLDMLDRRTLTDTERQMLDNGYKTRGMAFRQTFWYRLAYHGYREYGAEGCTLNPAVDETDGRFLVDGMARDRHPVFRFTVSRPDVARFLERFSPWLSNQNGLSVSPMALDLIFDASMRKDMGIDIQPALRMVQENGAFRLLDGIDLDRFQYGDLVYIPELKLLANMRKTETQGPRLAEKAKTVIEKSQVPAFLEAHREDLSSGLILTDDAIDGLRIFDRADRVELLPAAVDRDWCWLTVEVGFGDTKISLADLLKARKLGERYIPADDGWIDSYAPSVEAFLSGMEPLERPENETTKNALAFSRRELLRISALSDPPLTFSGRGSRVQQLRRLISGKPQTQLPDLGGMTAALRNYQKLGVEWLWYLVENGFGGLLCDDMGLGKTHQVMALMTAMVQSGAGHPTASHRFLVVCPTTVMGHWEEKIRTHAPLLSARVYHGGGRDLDEAAADGNVVITSYGILHRDIEQLGARFFPVAVFDEIQSIKNPGTHSHRAAAKIRAGVKFGLTGTPVENSVSDLKALMDLAVPGYLGRDRYFKSRYAEVIEADPHSPRRMELQRLIAPFTLRRLKSTVLTELPKKIEDTRTCALSEDQRKLYVAAIEQRREGLMAQLRSPNAAVPYLHIFALLSLLKQICDHPAIVKQEPADADRLASGKWDLFREILAESLDSGQKVVVYSQFLGMIDIIGRHLAQAEVGHVVLTGKSRNRAALINRFNTDPACRVFVGSLKAGGTGIDLVAASVVIHYDRWWNSAREDQATDRVHRIGQTRGVQVFKLITAGTLEEKIAAIIARKKHLADNVVPEDDPGVLKIFTRQDLMSLMDVSGLGGTP